uniref:C2H2-type domain-containing protein n=1 Tax=Glossina pallidipes TaxID=7398 RepID=A0A1B0AC14_GLOPL
MKTSSQAKKQAYHSNDRNDDQATSSYIYKNDHIKCGEVFTWLCEGEFFAVECHLCEDRPLCPLSEYAQHMEVWHIEWGEVWLGGCRALTAKNNEKANQTYDEIDDSQAGSSSCEREREREREGREDFIGNLEEQTLEPFEQVLIEEDLYDPQTTQHTQEEDVSVTPVTKTRYNGKCEMKTREKKSRKNLKKTQHVVNKEDKQRQQRQLLLNFAHTKRANKKSWTKKIKSKQTNKLNPYLLTYCRKRVQRNALQSNEKSFEKFCLRKKLLEKNIKLSEHLFKRRLNGRKMLERKKCKELNKTNATDCRKDKQQAKDAQTNQEAEIYLIERNSGESSILKREEEEVANTRNCERYEETNEYNLTASDNVKEQSKDVFTELFDLVIEEGQDDDSQKNISQSIEKIVNNFESSVKNANNRQCLVNSENLENWKNEKSFGTHWEKINIIEKSPDESRIIFVENSNQLQKSAENEKSVQEKYIENLTATHRHQGNEPTCEIMRRRSSSSHSLAFPSCSLTRQFQYHRRQMKVTTEQFGQLITLYRDAPCLWDQSDPQFCDAHHCKQVWQKITAAWNESCKRHFSTTNIRMRISNLCRRYLKEKERRQLKDELADSITFPYYEQMQFLENQTLPLQKRKEFYEKQNSIILEIYRNFPLLWHVRYYKVKCSRQRQQAWLSVRSALKFYGHNLSLNVIQKRIRSLRRCYRREKIRFLRSHVPIEKVEFHSIFKHYKEMMFLNAHTEPFECRTCKRIFENLLSYKYHFNNEGNEKCCVEEKEQQKPLDSYDLSQSKKNEDLIVFSPRCSNEAEASSLSSDVQDRILKNSTKAAIESTIEFSPTVKDDRKEAYSFQDVKAFETPPTPEDSLFHHKSSSNIRLTESEVHHLITLYQQLPQLWNPNHLDYNSRSLKRQAWQTLCTQLNNFTSKNYSWKTVYRKVLDYVKYYNREKGLIRKMHKKSINRWTFYKDFKFLDEVRSSHELSSTLQHNDSNIKIISIYKTLPQLWDTTHPNYNKHNNKQRSLEILCSRLQQECQVQLTAERVKQRLTDLKCQYRLAKKQRLDASKQEISFRADFEYYEYMTFLDQHVAPFICDICQTEFKRFKDFSLHQRREHEKCKRGRKQVMPLTPSDESEHVCHICGFTFTLRHNLRLHLQRHEGIRNHPCSFCPKRFYNSYSLKVHERSHTKEHPFTCEKCGQRFAIASKLNLHIKRHSGKCEYACGHCSKSFYTAFERDRHVRWHLNIRDKVCSTCGKTFVSGSSYYTHLMLHKEVKRYVCDKCDKRFAQHSGLYKHKKRHHQ